MLQHIVGSRVPEGLSSCLQRYGNIRFRCRLVIRLIGNTFLPSRRRCWLAMTSQLVRKLRYLIDLRWFYCRIEPDVAQGREQRLLPHAPPLQLRKETAQSRSYGQQDQQWVAKSFQYHTTLLNLIFSI